MACARTNRIAGRTVIPMLTLEQAIGHAEEVATEQELLMCRYDAASGYARSGNESIRTESAKRCEKCAADHRQLAEWLRELKNLRKAAVVKCKDCKWWRKQKDSAQGRCRLLGIYPTGAWYCGNAKRRTDADD